MFEGAEKWMILLPLVFLQAFVIPRFCLRVFQYCPGFVWFAYVESVVCQQIWGAGSTTGVLMGCTERTPHKYSALDAPPLYL